MGILRNKITGAGIGIVSLVILGGCDENGEFNLGGALAGKDATSAAASASGGRSVERDVEAPEVFAATEAGLWDGRPSLGGVWVAHPDVKAPERVIIRNTDNGKFVVGALFRREREIPGPRLQISSDAASALGVLAGAPANLDVTALRREQVQEEAAPEPTEAETVAKPADVSETPLDPIAAAGAAIDAAAPQPAQPAPAAPAPAAPVASSLTKPFIQVGIFSVKANADRTAAQMRNAGMVPTVREGSTSGKPFWRVIVGPAGNSSQRSVLLKKIKAEGFTDAYAVTN